MYRWKERERNMKCCHSPRRWGWGGGVAGSVATYCILNVPLTNERKKTNRKGTSGLDWFCAKALLSAANRKKIINFNIKIQLSSACDGDFCLVQNNLLYINRDSKARTKKKRRRIDLGIYAKFDFKSYNAVPLKYGETAGVWGRFRSRFVVLTKHPNERICHSIYIFG